MARVYVYDEGHVNERVLSGPRNVNTTDYQGRTDVVLYEDSASFPTLVEVMPYWRHDTGAVRDMNTAEKDALDAEMVAAQLDSSRDFATNEATSDNGQGARTQSIIQMSVVGDNVTRQWLTDFKAAVAAATDLADYKSRVAALPDMPQWTKQQAKDLYLSLVAIWEAD